MQLNPDILRTFMAAAGTLNFTRAGRQVNLSQSAVSMQINRLEQTLGKPLFQRITRGVALTPEGERLLKYAGRILRLHDEALASMTRPEVDGLIRLGAAEDYASQHLPMILRRFRERYPLVQVDIYCDLSQTLLSMLELDKLDLCLCNSENGEHGGTFLRHEPLVWIAPTGATPEGDSPLPLAMYHQGCIFRKWATQALTDHRIPFRIAYSSPSVSGILAAVRAGFAIAPTGASLLLDGLRVLPQGTLPQLRSAVISLHRNGVQPTPAQACLAEYITDEFRSMPLATIPVQPGGGESGGVTHRGHFDKQRLC